jgi:hypothetical protein
MSRASCAGTEQLFAMAKTDHASGKSHSGCIRWLRLLGGKGLKFRSRGNRAEGKSQFPERASIIRRGYLWPVLSNQSIMPQKNLAE